MKKGDLVIWKYGPSPHITCIILEFHTVYETVCSIFCSNGKISWVNEAQLVALQNIQ